MHSFWKIFKSACKNKAAPISRAKNIFSIGEVPNARPLKWNFAISAFSGEKAYFSTHSAVMVERPVA